MNEAFVDYLQFSILMREQECLNREEKPISGMGFYSRGYQDKLGTRHYFGNPNSAKALVVMSGIALHNRRVVGWSDQSTLGGVIRNGGKISRLDLAVTDYIEDDLVTVDDVASACEQGQVSGTLTNYGWKQISGADIGEPLGAETCYIGSPKRRGKNGIFRAYDKGLELGICSHIMTRLELEERKTNAHNSAKRIVDGASVKSVIKSRLEFKNERIKALMDAPTIDTSRGDSLIMDDPNEIYERKWLWLMNQVAPALRDAVEFDRKNGIGDDRLMNFLYYAGIVHDKN